MIQSFLQNLIIKVVKKISKAFLLSDIETAQINLAFSDSQNYIYENSTLNTLSFTGPKSVENLRKYCFTKISNNGSLFEFGVFKGKSLNYFAEILKNNNDNRKIIGFDSWKGFSEEWTGLNNNYTIKAFDQNGRKPKKKFNTVLVDGYIENTLPNFIKENHIDHVAFIHIDTDTYKPAKTILDCLKPFFKKGTIILFDELCGYPNWRSHEFRALNETLKPDQYEFLGFANNGNKAMLIKAAIRII